MSFRTLSDLDDDVKPVSFHTVGASSGGRVVTPSKAITIPRSTSANNRSSSAQKKDRTLYRALVETEVEKRAPSRNPSRRKQRQLENDNLVDLHRAMIEKGLCIDFDDDEEDGKIRHPHNRAKFSMRINFKSLFSELFEEKNCLVREEFRTCAIGTSSSSSQQAHVRRNIPIRKDQWNEAEACFYLIEVRLRNVVVRSLESEDLCHFVRSLECILLYYIAQQNIPSQVPLALVDKLESPLETTGGSLIVSLKDSSFYRLLLHATCQFYGLRSKVCLFSIVLLSPSRFIIFFCLDTLAFLSSCYRVLPVKVVCERRSLRCLHLAEITVWLYKRDYHW